MDCGIHRRTAAWLNTVRGEEFLVFDIPARAQTSADDFESEAADGRRKVKSKKEEVHKSDE